MAAFSKIEQDFLMKDEIKKRGIFKNKFQTIYFFMPV